MSSQKTHLTAEDLNISLRHMKLDIKLEAELDGEFDSGEGEVVKCYTFLKNKLGGGKLDHFDMTGHSTPYHYDFTKRGIVSDPVWDEKHNLFNRIMEQVRLDYPKATVLLKQLGHEYAPEQRSWKLGVVEKKKKRKNGRSDTDD